MSDTPQAFKNQGTSSTSKPSAFKGSPVNPDYMKSAGLGLPIMYESGSKYDSGILPFMNQEDYRYRNQSTPDVIGNSLIHLTGSAVNAALEIPAIAFGALKAPFVGWNSLAKGNGFVNAEVDAFNAYYDNEISRQVVDPINQWFQDTFKVYSSQKQKDSNFFSYENLTSGHFLDALLSGAGYTAGSFVTGAALTKAFGLAKIAATGAKVGESAESLIAEAANTAKKSIPLNLRSQLAIGTIMAGMESSLEARQTKDQILQKLKNSNLTEDQKQDIAESGSLANFAFNMAVLVPTNSLVFGRLIRPGGDAIESGIKTTFNTEGKVIEKQIANKYLRTAAKAIKNPITESLFEEGSQEYLQFASNQAINDYLNNKYNGNNASILRSIGSALYDGIATKEGLENTVIGGLMGVVAGGAAHIRNGKEEADRKKFQLEYINKNLPNALAVIKDKILDADRSITYQQNMDQNIAESNKENKFNYYNNKHSALVSLVQQHLNSGTLGILVDRIKGLKTASKEEINKLFGNEVTQSDLERWDSDDTINSLVKDINNIKDIHENVQRILPNPYNLKTQPKEFIGFRDLQNLLTHTASTIDNTTARIHNLNQQLNRFGITFNNTFYNNLTKEEKKVYLESTKKEIEDTNPVHHAHLNKELNDILNLNKRKEAFTAAYKTLSSEKGSKETLGKINTLQNEKEQPKPEQKSENEIIPDDLYNEFVNKGIVPQGILESIAQKVKNQQPLTDREKAIFTNKTKEINEIIANSIKQETKSKLPQFSREQHIKQRQEELDNTVEELINTEEEIKKVQQSLDESLAQLNLRWNSFRGTKKPNKGTIISKVLEDTNALKDRLNSLLETKKQLEDIITDIEKEIQFVKNNAQEQFSKEDVAEIQEKYQKTLDNVNEGISLINRLIFNIQSIIKRVSNLINKLISGFEKTYPNAPLVHNLKQVFEFIQQDKDKISNKYPEYQTFLQANPEYLKNLANFEKILNNNLDELDVSEKELENLKKSLELNVKLSQELQDKLRYINNLLRINENNKIIQKIPVQSKPEVKEKVKLPVSSNPEQSASTDDFNITIEKQGDLGNKIQVKVNQSGVWEDEKGNIYKPEDNYYEPGKTSINKGEKQVLFGTSHFLRMWFQGLADNIGFATKTKELIQKIAQLPNWRDYISVTVSQKQVKANLEEEKKNGKRTLFGDKKIKLQGRYDIDILFNLTDPETNEIPIEGANITALNNPNLFVFSNGVQVDFNDPQWNLTQFNLYFANDPRISTKPFTQEEFDEFKVEWNALKEFNNAVIAWYNTQNKEEAELPDEYLDILLSGSLHTGENIPLDSKEFGDVFINSPIISSKSPLDSINRKDMGGRNPLNFILNYLDERFQKSYFILAKLKNGLERWVRIQAKPIDIEFEQVLEKIKKARTDLLQPDISTKQADEITDTLNFWISSTPGSVIKFLHNNKKTGKYQLVLGYGTNSKITDRTSIPDLYEYKGTQYRFEDWNEEVLLAFINESIKSKGITPIKANNFKQDIDPLNADISQFETPVQPDILNNYTLHFKFNTSKVIEDTVQKEEQKPKISTIPVVIPTDNEEEDGTDALIQAIGEQEEVDSIEQEIQNLIDVGLTREQAIEAIKKSKGDSNDAPIKPKLYSDESLIDSEPKTFEEIKKRLLSQIPEGISLDRLDKILNALNLNGIPVALLKDAVLYLSDKMGYFDADHEAFHVIFNLVLSEEEQRRYLKAKEKELNWTPEIEAKEISDFLTKRPDILQLIKQGLLTRTDVKNLVIEEYLADDYADKRNNKELNQPKTWKQAIFNLFDKIIKFFTGRVKILDLFEKIDKGGFINSKVNKPNKFGFIVKAKLIGDLNAVESRNIIALIAAKYTSIKNTSSLNKILEDLITEYNPSTKGNKAILESRESEYDKKQLLDKLVKMYLGLKNNKELILDESSKYINYLGFDPEETKDDSFDGQTDYDLKNYNKLDSEVSPISRVSKEIKAFIASTIYTENFFGKKIEKAIDFNRVYYKLLSVLSNQPKEKVLSTLQALSSGNKDTDLKALYKKIKTETGYSTEFPEGSSFENSMFLKRFIGQFELSKFPYVSVFLDKDNNYAVKTTNKNDAGEHILNFWSTEWDLKIDSKFSGDKKFRNDLFEDFTYLINKIQGKTTPVNWKFHSENKNISTAVQEILRKIGIELELEYLEIAFDRDSPDNTVLKELLKANQRLIEVEDLYKIKNILFGNTGISEESSRQRNIYSSKENFELSNKLLGIATGSSIFSDDFIQPNYRTADNKNRYTYMPKNAYSLILDEVMQYYNSQEKIKNIPKDDFLYYNNILNNSNKNIAKQDIENLELALIGDSTFQEGKTYKDSTEQDILKILFSLFINKKNGYYYTAPSIIADKRSFYGVKVRYKEFFNTEGITKEGEKALENIFTQEYNRLQGMYGKNNVPIFLYLPILNNHLDILDKIKNDNNNIHKYFQSDVLPILKDFIKQSANNFDSPGLFTDTTIKQDFVLNYLINGISVQQLTEGDLAQIKYKDLGTWQKSYNKFFAEMFKREASLNASGKSRGSGYDRIAYTEDTEAWIHKKTHEVTYIKPDNLSEYESKSINPDDAQAFSTPLGKLKDLEQSGNITEFQRMALRKLSGKVLDAKTGIPIKPTQEERNSVDLIPSKDVVSGFDEQGNRIYYKMSIAYLDPWTYGYWDTKKEKFVPKRGSEWAFYRWELMDHKDNQIDLLIPKSASKVFFGKTIEIPDGTKDIKIQDVEKSTYKVPRRYRREQVLKESKNSTKVPYLTQIQQLIDFGLLDNEDTTRLRNLLQDTAVQLRNNTFNFLMNQLINPDGSIKKDLSYFKQKLKDLVESTTSDVQSIGLIDTTLNFAHNRQKMEQIFMSHFKPGFQHKLNGDKLTMISPIVYRTVRNEEGIVIPKYQLNSDEYKDYPISDLRVTWENGIPVGEIVISEFTAKKLGLKIGDTVITQRVPNQGYNFMGNSKIVDILPGKSSFIIASPQLVAYAGQDFDDDSLYIFTKERHGKQYYGESTDPDTMWEEFRDWHMLNTPDVKDEAHKLFIQDKYYDVLNEVRELILQKKDLNELLNSSDGTYDFLFKLSKRQINEILKDRILDIEDLKENISKRSLEKFNLPGTKEDFILVGSPQSQGALNNTLINTIQEIMQRPELQKYFTQINSDEQTESVVQKIRKELESDLEISNIFTPDGLLKAFRNNTASTELRGNAVLAQTTGATLAKNKVDLNPEFWITYNGTIYKTFNSTPEERFENNKRASEKVNVVLDNAKDPKAGDLQWTKNNLSTFAYLNQLGIDIENGDGILSVQPILIRAKNYKSYELPALFFDIKNEIKNIIDADYNFNIKKIGKEKARIKAIELEEYYAEVTNTPLNSKDLWKVLELRNSTDPMDQLFIIGNQIKVLELYIKANEIANFAYNISRLNTLTRTIGSSLDDAQNFLDAFDNITIPKTKKVKVDGVEKEEIIPNPFNTDQLLRNEKNIVNNVNNLKKIFEISKHLFISKTNLAINIQDTMLDMMVGSPNKNKAKVRSNIQAYIQTYIQTLLYKKLNSNVKFNELLTPLKGGTGELITEKYNKLLQYPEFRYNKFVRLITPLNPGEQGNDTPIHVLKYDSITTPSKELTEVLIDSINQLINSDNPEISQFGEDLLNYEVAKHNMEFLNSSFIRLIPVRLLKPLGQRLQMLNDELAKKIPDEKLIEKLTGKNSYTLKKDFIELFVNNVNNHYSLDSDKLKLEKNKKYIKVAYQYSTKSRSNEYMKPYVNTIEENNILSIWLRELYKKIKSQDSDKKSTQPDENVQTFSTKSTNNDEGDYFGDESEDNVTYLPFDEDLDNSENSTNLDENNLTEDQIPPCS